MKKPKNDLSWYYELYNMVGNPNNLKVDDIKDLTWDEIVLSMVMDIPLKPKKERKPKQVHDNIKQHEATYR